MVEPERKGLRKKKKHAHTNTRGHFYLDLSANLEDTVRNLREENAKLMQLLRSRKLIAFPH